MQKDVRTRLRRVIVGAIASSNLDATDLPILARLLADETFVREVTDVLRPLLRPADGVGPPVAPVAITNVSRTYDLAESLLSAVRTRKLGKDRLQRYLREISPEFYSSAFRSDASMEQVINEFVSNVSTDQAYQLLRRLSGGEDDPYLKGMTRR